jgi:hypothetical protein
MADTYEAKVLSAHLPSRTVTFVFPEAGINHIDGNKANNDLANLEWVTHAENMAHAYRTGLAKARDNGPGERSPAAKLNWDQVRHIRALLAHGASQQSVADLFGVRQGTIGFIARNETWRVLA